MGRKVIIDCDPGIDDSLAIMLALSMKQELEVLGITIVAGNAPVEMGAENALKVLRFMNRLEVPVFQGADRPLKKEFVNALDTHGADGLGESWLPDVPETDYVRQSMGAVEFLSQAIRGKTAPQTFRGETVPQMPCEETSPQTFREELSPKILHEEFPPQTFCEKPAQQLPHGEPLSQAFREEKRQEPEREKVSVIALGPLTNLAILAAEDPEAFGQIDELVSMGGCFRSHGNCSPVAEYNYWCDPEAADVVYREMDRRKKQIHMVGLDVTRRIVLTPDLLTYMKRLHPETGAFVEAITKFYFDFHWDWEHLIGCVINDPLAVAYFARKNICKGFSSYVQIDKEGPGRGQTIVDAMHFYRHAPNAVVLTQVDRLAFFRLFFAALLHMEEEEADLLPDLVRL